MPKLGLGCDLVVTYRWESSHWTSEWRTAETSLEVPNREVGGVAVHIPVRKKKCSKDLGFGLGGEVVVDTELLDESVDDVVKVASFKVEK